MDFKCKCHNSGTNCFTGNCSVCGMSKAVSIVDVMKPAQLRNNLLMEVLNTERYNCTYDGMVLENDGEYVLLDDILKIFGGEKI